jgi:flagellar hook-length control protein FliK
VIEVDVHMNDMRLPGLALVNSETPPNPASPDAGRDPAQAFDAVMSRFSGQRAPAPNSNQDAPARPADTAGRNPAKSTAPAKGQDAAPRGAPAARTKAQDDDDDCTNPAATVQGTDPAALVAAVTGSAQLAAQDPAVAATLNGVVAAQAGKDKDAKNRAAASGALDVLAGQANVVAARAGEWPAADTRARVASEDEPKPVAGATSAARRAPAAAKDTLRIDAPLARALEAGKSEVAPRSSSFATAVIQAAAQNPSPAAPETPAQIIAGVVAAAGNTADTYSIAHAAIAAPVGTPAFANELSQRVVVFAGQKVQRAEIALTPPELGPIAVSIEVRGHEATLAFSAANHATRVAIEDALPRLRDMLSAQGLQLAGTHVGSEPRRDPYRPPSSDRNAAGNRGTREGVPAVAGPVNIEIRRRTNLIDIEV